MVRTAALGLIVLLLAGCAAPPPRVLRPVSDPFAGLAPPPLPAPATFPFRGSLGPVERGDPPVVIVPLPDSGESPRIGELSAPEESGNAYGRDAPYDDGIGSVRRR